MSRTLSTRLLVILLGVFLVSEVYLWKATHGFPAMLDQSETTIKFLAGRNFDRFGLLKQRLTPDFATSSDATAHPMYYTHYADFTDHFAYVLIKIGVATIPGQVFVGILVTGAGLYVMFLTVEAYLGSRAAALCVLLISVIDYASVLVAALNTHKDWAWLVVFVPLWALKRFADTRGRRYLWIALTGYFLLAYYDYGLLVYVTLVLACLKTLSLLRGLTWRELALFVCVGGVTSVVLHEALVLAALGPSSFLTDAKLTYMNRIAGTLPRRDLVRFYQDKGIVLWGYEEPGTLAKNAGVTWTRILQIVGTPACWIIGLLTVASVLIAVGGRWAQRRGIALAGYADNDILKADLIISLMAPFAVMFPVFHIQMTVLYASAWAPLYVFPESIVMGIALFVAVRTTIEYARARSMSMFPLAICAMGALAIPGLFLATQLSHVFGDFPIREYPGHQVLDKYKGHSFVTNYQGAYVSYFTGEWAIYHGMAGVTPGHFPRIDEVSRSYIFERDVVTNPEKYNHPDYAVMVGADHPGLSKGFPLVEKGKDYWIYDLRGSKP